jgi:hypothetical protein
MHAPARLLTQLARDAAAFAIVKRNLEQVGLELGVGSSALLLAARDPAIFGRVLDNAYSVGLTNDEISSTTNNTLFVALRDDNLESALGIAQRMK